MLSLKPRNARRPTLAPLLVLALSLSACASKPTLVPVTPALPTAPALSTPLPPQPYSMSVEQLFKRWRSMLTDTSTTSEPSPERGPAGSSPQR